MLTPDISIQNGLESRSVVSHNLHTDGNLSLTQSSEQSRFTDTVLTNQTISAAICQRQVGVTQNSLTTNSDINAINLDVLTLALVVRAKLQRVNLHEEFFVRCSIVRLVQKLRSLILDSLELLLVLLCAEFLFGLLKLLLVNTRLDLSTSIRLEWFGPAFWQKVLVGAFHHQDQTVPRAWRQTFQPADSNRAVTAAAASDSGSPSALYACEAWLRYPAEYSDTTGSMPGIWALISASMSGGCRNFTAIFVLVGLQILRGKETKFTLLRKRLCSLLTERLGDVNERSDGTNSTTALVKVQARKNTRGQ
ncbi:ABC transporter domain-containing protein, partial [Aureobasidium melanogenum]